jgi:hypothetical protein
MIIDKPSILSYFYVYFMAVVGEKTGEFRRSIGWIRHIYGTFGNKIG